ncbi:hypothetical protein CBR_g38660 [Chara braunii]|uniref:Reverse transcriptase domain-containing protein n=1 Tax=Chara braunii TaxID=69332 RepID=A0A388K0L7_CHABU|nr:hypothetical protein CBR_g38660 [Chara braunii]|eukprot:GBG63594.1 hypothetical protein CBR_g38660 [Chara braunii]
MGRSEGHVKVRLCEVENVPGFLRNSKNVTPGSIIRPEALESCIREGVDGWVKGRKDMILHRDIDLCYGGRDDVNNLAMTTNEVRNCFRKYSKLIEVPIDRNPGATLLLCPVLYHRAYLETFNRNHSFRVVQRSEDQVRTKMKEDYVEGGLNRIARWQTGGKISQAYVLPKDKDLDRWRPISPCTTDPARVAAARVGRAVRYMLFGLRRAEHFDLKSMDELGERCRGIQREFRARGDVAIARSYHIKDMFARLSHEKVMEAVDWVISYHERKGLKGVRVSMRGKLCAMVRKVRKEDGFVVMKFEDIKREVAFELSHSFVRCAGSIMVQRFGIPMGRNYSPALACLVCAMAESAFMKRAVGEEVAIRGMRMIDDVAVMVGCASDRPETFRKAIRILDVF